MEFDLWLNSIYYKSKAEWINQHQSSINFQLIWWNWFVDCEFSNAGWPALSAIKEILEFLYGGKEAAPAKSKTTTFFFHSWKKKFCLRLAGLLREGCSLHFINNHSTQTKKFVWLIELLEWNERERQPGLAALTSSLSLFHSERESGSLAHLGSIQFTSELISRQGARSPSNSINSQSISPFSKKRLMELMNLIGPGRST